MSRGVGRRGGRRWIYIKVEISISIVIDIDRENEREDERKICIITSMKFPKNKLEKSF